MKSTVTRNGSKALSILAALLFCLSAAAGGAWAQGVLTLEECIKRALEGNRELEAFRSRVEAASARVDEAAAGLNPRLSVVGKYLWAGEEQRLWPARFDGEPGIYDDQFFEASAVLDMPLFDAGRTRNRTWAERKLHEASLASLESLGERLRFDVERLFYTILAQKEAVWSLEAALESLTRHENDVAAMLKAGKAARVDALRVASEVDSTRSRLLEARHELVDLKESLLMVMGGGSAEGVPEIDGTFPEVPGPPGGGGLLEEALSSRSDYKAAMATVEAREFGIRAARAATSPQVSLRGVHARRNALGGGSESRTDVELHVEIPLYDGGVSDARARQASSEAEAARAEARDLAARVGYEVSESLRALSLSQEKTVLAKSALEAAEEGLRIEKLKYRSGKGTTTDVLAAHAAWLSALAEETAARAATAIAAARLDFVSGGAAR